MAVGIIRKSHTLTEEEISEAEWAAKLERELQKKEVISSRIKKNRFEIETKTKLIKQREAEQAEADPNYQLYHSLEESVNKLQKEIEALTNESEMLSRELEETEREIIELQAEKERKNFHKKIALENIRFLLSLKPVKLGEIEKDAGVSRRISFSA